MLLSFNEWTNSLPNSLDPNARLEGVLRCVKDAATDTVGMPPPPPSLSSITQYTVLHIRGFMADHHTYSIKYIAVYVYTLATTI